MRKIKKLTFEELVQENKRELLKDEEAINRLEESVLNQEALGEIKAKKCRIKQMNIHRSCKQKASSIKKHNNIMLTICLYKCFLIK